ncbi:MAG TPA: GTP 3',8-cyclase MoaA [Chitinophagaceae bacterium]|nr:GTP 3',8-cyclase MoaA [Chitinophagaceae bacterium]
MNNKAAQLLIDNHGRVIDYLRLAVTDRCNLRCAYCMPAEGLDWLSRKEIMSYDEMLRLCSVLIEMGIKKIRITGGEPFVRKDMLHFLTQLSQLPGLQQLNITTNGVLTAPLMPRLKEIGIGSINLSLDTLDRRRFLAITRRDELDAVLRTLEAALKHGLPLKINAVVMDGKNIEDIVPLVTLTKELPVTVRFIEEMPFNGMGREQLGIAWDYRRILGLISKHFNIQKIQDPPASTSLNYSIPGHTGTVGVIPAYTRSFCGTCNRIRVTPDGSVKTCLYDVGALNIKDLLRMDYSNEQLKSALMQASRKKAATGREAEARAANSHPSMASIGG